MNCSGRVVDGRMRKGKEGKEAGARITIGCVSLSLVVVNHFRNCLIFASNCVIGWYRGVRWGIEWLHAAVGVGHWPRYGWTMSEATKWMSEIASAPASDSRRDPSS